MPQAGDPERKRPDAKPKGPRNPARVPVTRTRVPFVESPMRKYCRYAEAFRKMWNAAAGPGFTGLIIALGVSFAYAETGARAETDARDARSRGGTSQNLWVNAGLGWHHPSIGGHFALNYDYRNIFMLAYQEAFATEVCFTDDCGEGIYSRNLLLGKRVVRKYGFAYAAVGIGLYRATLIKLASEVDDGIEIHRTYSQSHPSGLGIPFEIGLVLGKYGGLEIVPGCNLNSVMPTCGVSIGIALGKFN